MKLEITAHAQRMMIERGIEQKLVKKAIKQGAKYRQTDGFKAVYSYFAVCYKKIGEGTYKIKTVEIL